MSLRRRACNACHTGRRKCDLDLPSCGSCCRAGKDCRYLYAPIQSTLTQLPRPERDGHAHGDSGESASRARHHGVADVAGRRKRQAKVASRARLNTILSSATHSMDAADYVPDSGGMNRSSRYRIEVSSLAGIDSSVTAVTGHSEPISPDFEGEHHRHEAVSETAPCLWLDSSIDLNPDSSPSRTSDTDPFSGVSTGRTAAGSPSSLPATNDTPSTTSTRRSSPQMASPKPSAPNFVGPLGIPQPVVGRTESWRWAIEQFKSLPREFAQRGETIFLPKHLHLYSRHDGDRGGSGTVVPLPRTIRAALGVASAYAVAGEDNRDMLFQIVSAEVLELMLLLTSSANGVTEGPSVLEELAQLQALLIYQIIQLLCGGIEQRVMAEQQRDITLMAALRLVRRVNRTTSKTEGGGGESHVEQDQSWHDWVVAESVRRTVLLLFCLFTMNDVHRHGVCLAFDALSQLPVTNRSDLYWDMAEAEFSRAQHEGGDEKTSRGKQTVQYARFTQGWLDATPRRLGRFETMVLVMCKGLDIVKAHSLP
ncbi:uncharacterized protein B0I36DRAFT_332443 [Microdochium trichocladiopsis]|uniref:Zn(2)-C6 fungal-type domain-containing protein n=1 Tax=Microdochium trichocladiopsis TaxID=1682393 RepID=A0A9P9BJA6_9PEZI|nr:uncharacterized protein B0I36DRAFT_332443 [Microdochium trichocladiopsis]KAH7025043.1 hypothetical protein B0I36DRAFT_332443 [Microdochium trichocladiopsis]